MIQTHLYFVPGMAASPKIFDFLELQDENICVHFLEWLVPSSIDESIESYARRMCEFIREDHVILVGVSFGGMMVQEMSKHINAKKVIIISSLKSRDELPKRLKLLQKTNIYKLLPTKSVTNIEGIAKYVFGEEATKRIELYKVYLSVRNERYLNWAIHNVLNWNQKEILPNLVHIHGNKDRIFPIKHIKNCIIIEGANHIMILTKAKKISRLIREEIINC